MSNFPVPGPFQGFAITDGNAEEVIHEMAELCLFRAFLEGITDHRGRYIMDSAKAQLRRLLQVSSDDEIPVEMLKQVSAEASNLLCDVGRARLVELTYLENGSKKKAYLPLSAFSPSLKRRVYENLVHPAKQELEMFHQMKKQLTYYDKAVRCNREVIDDLSRRLGVREPIDHSTEVSRLKAELQDAKQRYDEIKSKYQIVSEAEADAFWRKLKQAQERVNQLASELQKMEQRLKDSA